MLLLTKLIDATPPLPQSVFALNELRMNPDRSLKEVAGIVERDPVLSAKLLSLVNAPFYGTRQEIVSIQSACNYLGENSIFSMALLIGLHNHYGFDLSPYGLDEKRFLQRTLMQSQLMGQWLRLEPNAHADALRLAAFVSDIGKVLISHMLIREGRADDFTRKLQRGVIESIVEKEFFGATTLEVSALMLEHWKVHSGAAAIMRYTVSNVRTPDALQHAVGMLESVHALWHRWHQSSETLRQDAIMSFAMLEKGAYQKFETALESVLSSRSA